MKFYLYTIKTRLKLSVNKFFIAAVMMYFLFAIVILFGYRDPMASMSKIGFVYNENEFTNDFIEQYNYYGSEFFMANKYEDKYALEEAVQKNDIDCGYVLPDSFDSGKIEYIYSNKTVTGIYNNLLISSIYLQNDAGDLGYKAIKKAYKNKDNKELIKQQVNKLNKEYLENAPFMEYSYTGVNGEEINSNNGIYIIMYGVIGLFMTLIGLIFYLQTIYDKDFNIYLNLKSIDSKLKYYIGNLTAYFIILFIFGYFNILLINYNFLGRLVSFRETIVIGAFTLGISSVVFTFSRIKNISVASLITMFYFITASIFGYVFIEINTVLKYIYPTFYFKEGFFGSNFDILLIALFIVIINILNYFIISKNYLKGKNN